MDADRVDKWYEALMEFLKIVHKEVVQFKMNPGDILTFANNRLLHGRTGYVDTDGNVRHLVAGYLDWDELYSRWRVLLNDAKANKDNE